MDMAIIFAVSAKRALSIPFKTDVRLPEVYIKGHSRQSFFKSLPASLLLKANEHIASPNI